MQNLTIYKASAGSGKTHILTREYLKLAFQSPDNFKNILAVTFTNKAADEMKVRIIDELNNIIAGKGSKDLKSTLNDFYLKMSENQIRERAQFIRDNILHNYSMFSVGTIDSFTQRVIRSFSYEIGIHSGYRIEMDTDKVIFDLTELLYRQIDKDKDLLKWLVDFAKYKIDEGKSWDFRDEISSLSKEIFKEKFQKFSKEIIFKEKNNNLNKNYLNDFYKQLFTIRRTFENRLRSFSKETRQMIENQNINYTQLGKNFTVILNFLLNKIDYTSINCEYQTNQTVEKALEGVENWYAKSAKSEVVDQIISVFPGLSDILKNVVDEINVNYKNYLSAVNTIQNFHAFGILNDIASLLPDYRDENNILLISDTTVLLREIIENCDAPFIYEKVGSRYKNILIDEFQDTSNFQWDNFKPLIKNSISEGYENLIVGDIKQSIYRWRGGDWKLLLKEVQKDIGDNNVKIKSLDFNWRSTKNIIDFNNVIFQNAPKILQEEFNRDLESIPDENDKYLLLEENVNSLLVDAYFDSYQNNPDIENNIDGFVKVKFYKVDKRTEMVSKWRQQVNNDIPVLIESLLNENQYKPSDIGILVRKNKEGKEIVNLLLNYMNQHPEARHYNIISSESLYIYNSPSINLLINAFKFLIDEEDTISLTNLVYEYQNLLTSEIEDFHTIFTYYKNQDQIKKLLPLEFIGYLPEFQKLTIYELTERLISVFKINDLPKYFPFIRTFQDVIFTFSKNETSDLSSFVNWWEKEGKNISIQLSETTDAVNVMTIHKAKGLAFEVVIIPYCDWPTDHPHFLSPIVWCKANMPPYDSFSYLPINYKRQLAETIYFKDYFEEKLYANMDALNALYVAFTRPRKELYIMAPTDFSNNSQYVSDLLYNSIASTQTISNNEDKTLINLTEYYNENVNTLILGNLHKIIPRQSIEKDPALSFIELYNYPSINWRKKLTIARQSQNFFTGDISEIGQRINHGILMHEILMKIKTLQDLDFVVQEMIFTGKLSNDLIIEIRNQLSEMMNIELVKDWFSDKWQVITERPLLTKTGQLKIPDRVLINSDQTIVIDFKFGEQSDDHLIQIKEYKSLLSEMAYPNISGYLYYPEKEMIIKV